MQRPDQIIVVDDGATAGIDDHGAILHLFEDFSVEHVGGLWGQHDVDGDDVAAGDQLLKGHELHIRVLRLDGITDVGVAADDLGAEAIVENVVEMAARQAKAVEAQGQFPHIGGQQVLAFGPVALAHLPVIVGGIADQPHDHGGGHIGQFLGAEAWQVQNDDPQLRGGRQVDAVDAGTEPLYELDLRQGLHHLAGDGRIAGGQKDLGSLAARDDLLFCGLLLPGRLHLVLQQLHLDARRLIGR